MNDRVRINFGSYKGKLGTLRPDLGAGAEYTYVKPDGAAAPILLREDEYERYLVRPVRITGGHKDYIGWTGDIIHEPQAAALFPDKVTYEVALYPGNDTDGLFAVPLKRHEFEDLG